MTAIASASAASSLCGDAFGSSTPIIMRICALSPWPAPTIDFFTRFGAYSATLKPGLRRHQHGDATRLPELERRARIGVDESVLDRGLLRRKLLDHFSQPGMNGDEPLAEFRAFVGLDRAAGDVDQPVAIGLDEAPAGAAKPGIDAEDANQAPHKTSLIDP